MVNVQDLEQAEVMICEGLEGLKNGLREVSRLFRTVSLLEIQIVGGRMVPGNVAKFIQGPDGRPAMAPQAGQVQLVFLLVAAGKRS